MAGNRDPNRLPRVLAEHQGGDAAKRGAAAGEQSAVERGQRHQRVVGQHGRRAQGVAGQRGDRGGLGATPGDVADHQHPAAGDAEGVVEVAADLVLGPGRPVHRRQRPARDVRQRRRQKAVLERLGDLGAGPLGPLEVGEKTAVVERKRDTAGEDPGEACVAALDSAGPTRRRQGSGARHLAPRLQRDRDRRAHAQAAQEVEIGAVVVGEPAQVRLGHPLDEARLERRFVACVHLLGKRRLALPAGRARSLGRRRERPARRRGARCPSSITSIMQKSARPGNEDVADRRRRSPPASRPPRRPSPRRRGPEAPLRSSPPRSRGRRGTHSSAASATSSADMAIQFIAPGT